VKRIMATSWRWQERQENAIRNAAREAVPTTCGEPNCNEPARVVDRQRSIIDGRVTVKRRCSRHWPAVCS